MIQQNELPDTQRNKDPRGIAIDQVGVSNIRFPFKFPLKSGGTFNTVAKLSMRVSLPHHQKGTHMSRFMVALQEREHEFQPNTIDSVLKHLMDLLEAEQAFIDMSFPIFLERPAPVTGHKGILDYECVIKSVMEKDGPYDHHVGVEVNAASLCPCSKAISDYGAHNQRSKITIKVRPTDGIIWFEDLIEIAEESASCQLYPILKREDERHVTQRAYDNPKFVEDIVRDVAVRLETLMEENLIEWFFVSSNNYESIHNHDAFALIERGDPGKALTQF